MTEIVLTLTYVMLGIGFVSIYKNYVNEKNTNLRLFFRKSEKNFWFGFLVILHDVMQD